MLEKLSPKKKRKASVPERVVQWLTSLTGSGAKRGSRKATGKAKATAAKGKSTGSAAKRTGARAKAPAKRAGTGTRTTARRKERAAR
jgi:hypothetical protein